MQKLFTNLIKQYREEAFKENIKQDKSKKNATDQQIASFLQIQQINSIMQEQNQLIQDQHRERKSQLEQFQSNFQKKQQDKNSDYIMPNQRHLYLYQSSFSDDSFQNILQSLAQADQNLSSSIIQNDVQEDFLDESIKQQIIQKIQNEFLLDAFILKFEHIDSSFDLKSKDQQSQQNKNTYNQQVDQQVYFQEQLSNLILHSYNNYHQKYIPQNQSQFFLTMLYAQNCFSFLQQKNYKESFNDKFKNRSKKQLNFFNIKLKMPLIPILQLNLKPLKNLKILMITQLIQQQNLIPSLLEECFLNFNQRSINFKICKIQKRDFNKIQYDSQKMSKQQQFSQSQPTQILIQNKQKRQKSIFKLSQQILNQSKKQFFKTNLIYLVGKQQQRKAITDQDNSSQKQENQKNLLILTEKVSACLLIYFSHIFKKTKEFLQSDIVQAVEQSLKNKAIYKFQQKNTSLSDNILQKKLQVCAFMMRQQQEKNTNQSQKQKQNSPDSSEIILSQSKSRINSGYNMKNKQNLDQTKIPRKQNQNQLQEEKQKQQGFAEKKQEEKKQKYVQHLGLTAQARLDYNYQQIQDMTMAQGKPNQLLQIYQQKLKLEHELKDLLLHYKKNSRRYRRKVKNILEQLNSVEDRLQTKINFLEEQQNQGDLDSFLKLNQFSEMLKIQPISKGEKLNKIFNISQYNQSYKITPYIELEDEQLRKLAKLFYLLLKKIQVQFSDLFYVTEGIQQPIIVVFLTKIYFYKKNLILTTKKHESQNVKKIISNKSLKHYENVIMSYFKQSCQEIEEKHQTQEIAKIKDYLKTKLSFSLQLSKYQEKEKNQEISKDLKNDVLKFKQFLQRYIFFSSDLESKIFIYLKNILEQQRKTVQSNFQIQKEKFKILVNQIIVLSLGIIEKSQNRIDKKWDQDLQSQFQKIIEEFIEKIINGLEYPTQFKQSQATKIQQIEIIKKLIESYSQIDPKNFTISQVKEIQLSLDEKIIQKFKLENMPHNISYIVTQESNKLIQAKLGQLENFGKKMTNSQVREKT